MSQVLDICGGATGDRTPDLMTASDKKSRAGLPATIVMFISTYVIEEEVKGFAAIKFPTLCCL